MTSTTPQSHDEGLERYAQLRAASCPVAHEESHGGYWLLTRYKDVSKAGRDWRTYRSGQPFVEFPGFALSIPIASNPPEHTAYRKLLNSYFTPGRVAEIEPRIRGFVVEHVSALLEGGQGDAVAELCTPLPQRVLAAQLNMPDDTYQVFVAKLARLAELGDDTEAINELVANLWTDEVVELVGSRTEHPLDPANDLMTGVLAYRTPEGEPLPPHIAVAIGIQIFAAGGDTTGNALSSVLCHLATHPDDQQRLRSEPALIATAVEELLRLYPPLHQLARNATTDVELDGVEIHEGDLVALSWAAANRDGDQFDEPETCQFDRAPNRHLTFGTGPHQCIGAPIARLELQLVVAELLSRTTSIELDGEPVPLVGAPVRAGFASLPLRFS